MPKKKKKIETIIPQAAADALKTDVCHHLEEAEYDEEEGRRHKDGEWLDEFMCNECSNVFCSECFGSNACLECES